jgi:hypothetical protein
VALTLSSRDEAIKADMMFAVSVSFLKPKTFPGANRGERYTTREQKITREESSSINPYEALESWARATFKISFSDDSNKKWKSSSGARVYMSFSIPARTSWLVIPVGNSYLTSTASAFEFSYSKPSVTDGPRRHILCAQLIDHLFQMEKSDPARTATNRNREFAHPQAPAGSLANR